MKDHLKEELVSDLTLTAVQFANTQQLRERLRKIIIEALDQHGRDVQRACAAAVLESRECATVKELVVAILGIHLDLV